jgi:sec-independent protein translocase protein TatA
MSMPGMYELIIIFGVAVLFFGGKKLPELGGALGESIRNFKKSIKETEEKPDQKPDQKQIAEVKADINKTSGD